MVEIKDIDGIPCIVLEDKETEKDANPRYDFTDLLRMKEENAKDDLLRELKERFKHLQKSRKII